MDRTVVVAVALALGSLLLWSLMILVEDMADARRGRSRHLAGRATGAATTRDDRPTRPPRREPEWADDPRAMIARRPLAPDDARFEQLVDQFFGAEDRSDDPWRRSA